MGKRDKRASPSSLFPSNSEEPGFRKYATKKYYNNMRVYLVKSSTDKHAYTGGL